MYIKVQFMHQLQNSPNLRVKFIQRAFLGGLLLCDGCSREGCSVSRGQDDLQEDLGGAATLHPGRPTDGFRLNTDTQGLSSGVGGGSWSNTPVRLGPDESRRRSYPDHRAEDEGLLAWCQPQHPLHHAAKGERAACYGLVPDRGRVRAAKSAFTRVHNKKQAKVT